ncbi:hypothetical protein GOP47_0024095 [Adiantum capillus-veneris]|uniref:Uncharacterized protein n=1 Tax=Adiantum capillus-veneris TaxID=13818 RepID=A0A9D4U5R9_ADICA|nr:hypothetical protein GOP47_0024095 [Adiantum capillus-veneris]
MNTSALVWVGETRRQLLWVVRVLALMSLRPQLRDELVLALKRQSKLDVQSVCLFYALVWCVCHVVYRIFVIIAIYPLSCVQLQCPKSTAALPNPSSQML